MYRSSTVRVDHIADYKETSSQESKIKFVNKKLNVQLRELRRLQV